MVVTFINHSKAAKFTLNLVICIKSILSCLQVSFFWKQTHIFSFDLILTKIGTISIVVIIIVFQRKRNPIQLSKQAINRWMDLLSKKDAALQQNLLPECLCPHFPIMPANYHYLWTDPIYYSHQHHKTQVERHNTNHASRRNQTKPPTDFCYMTDGKQKSKLPSHFVIGTHLAWRANEIQMGIF